ncbi:hypothetical protein NPIL_616871 [Nephila pilipes]|uniref:Uncharacterized protein n=1 Tax=Nephila pilipes TaxID=299642 RepID=A0A8X6P7X7_NEPPI|nr:hypothetical protein NPIL_616871 [Nephila pilipes]
MACAGGNPIFDLQETMPLIHEKNSKKGRAGDKNLDIKFASKQDAVLEENKNPNREPLKDVEPTGPTAEDIRRKKIKRMKRLRWTLYDTKREEIEYYRYLRDNLNRPVVPFGVCPLILLVLLMPWPLSMGVMGFIYMSHCPMNEYLVFSLFLQCVMGLVVLCSRMLRVVHLMRHPPRHRVPDPIPRFMMKIVKYMEFLFLCFFIVQLSCYYTHDYSPSPIDEVHYCHPTLYSYITRLNYVSLSLVMIWLLMYFCNGCHDPKSC